MVDKALPNRPTKSPDLVEGDPSSTPDVKHGEADEPETSSIEQPAHPSAPVVQASVNPGKARKKADRLSIPMPWRIHWPFLIPFRQPLHLLFHEEVEFYEQAVSGYNCFPSDLKRLEAEDIRHEWKFGFPQRTPASTRWQVPEIRVRRVSELAQPTAGITGLAGQEEEPVPGTAVIQSSTATEASGARPTLRRWASWPPIQSVPWPDDGLEEYELYKEERRLWWLMEERAHQG